MARPGIGNTVFTGTVVVLLLITAGGFTLYFTKPGATDQLAAGGATAIPFKPTTGQMIHDAWLTVGRTTSGQYALSFSAQGLDATVGTDNIYIIEGTQSSGSMAVMPIGPNATASEFNAGSAGIGGFFILLSQNPFSSYKNIEVLLIPGMHMNQATVVATATLSAASH